MAEKRCILIVEDEIYHQEIVEYILGSLYQLFFAETGKKAIDYLSKKSFDLILLDIHLPDMEGFDIVNYMTEKKIECPFMFLTASSEMEDKIKGLELGADDFILKPFDKDELILRIKQKLMIRDKIKKRDLRLNTIYHNIATPINFIQGYIELQDSIFKKFRTDYLSQQNGEEYIIKKTDFDDFEKNITESYQYLFDSSKSLLQIANHYSELFEKKEVDLTKTSVNLTELLQKAYFLIKPITLELTINNPFEELIIEVDVDKFFKVLYEIFDNAVLQNDNRERKMDLNISLKNGLIYFCFKDNGRIINEEDFESIFEEFWTGYEKNNHPGGDGIGLWICKRFIQAHNGNIWIEPSNDQYQSQICFTLPLSK